MHRRGINTGWGNIILKKRVERLVGEEKKVRIGEAVKLQ